MDPKAVVKICRDMGCCDCCSLRFVGVKSPYAYVNCHNHIVPYEPPETNGYQLTDGNEDGNEDGNDRPAGHSRFRFPIDPQTKDPIPKRELDAMMENLEPSAKRKKIDNCVTCLGILQRHTWEQAADMVKEVIAKKQYTANSFAAALSAPICTIYRERVVCARLMLNVPEFSPEDVTSLKEGWKWSFAPYLGRMLGMKVESGKYAPLLITLNYEYPDDLQELEILKTLSPLHFAERAQQRRFTVEFTRRSVIEALDDVEDSVLAATRLTANTPASCVSVVACHEPVYLAGRYIKLSRLLPQTPWLVQGRRMVASSVQDIIFTPIARLYGMPMEDIEHRLKFMSAGREDVDVRCLGEGRPFAIEISDPRRTLTEEELAQVCEEISQDKQVIVKQLVHVNKDALVTLKKGEETKSKTYEALIIKLKPINDTIPIHFGPAPVTENDIECINKFAPITLLQRTPLRVLHRRPLLTRRREIFELRAELVENQPTLIKLHLKSEAGTYIKEFVHGECGRTQPCLADALKPKPIKISENIKDTDEESENVEEKDKDENIEKKDKELGGNDKKKELKNVEDEDKESGGKDKKKESVIKESVSVKEITKETVDEDKEMTSIDESNMECENDNKLEQITGDGDEKPEDMIRFDILALDVESVNLKWPIIS